MGRKFFWMIFWAWLVSSYFFIAWWYGFVPFIPPPERFKAPDLTAEEKVIIRKLKAKYGNYTIITEAHGAYFNTPRGKVWIKELEGLNGRSEKRDRKKGIYFTRTGKAYHH